MVLDVYIKGYLQKVRFAFWRVFYWWLLQDRLEAAMLFCRRGCVYDDQVSPFVGNGMDYLCRRGYVVRQYTGTGRKYWVKAPGNGHEELRNYIRKNARRMGKTASSDCVEVYR